MARQKKDGTNVSFYLDREIMERIRVHADENGQTLTKAIERLVAEALDIRDKEILDK